MMSEELDFESEIPVTNFRSLNETEYSTHDVVKKKLDTEEVISGTREDVSYTGQVKSGVGVVVSGTVVVKYNIGQVVSDSGKENSVEEVSDNGEVKSDTGEIDSDVGEIHSETGEISDDEESCDLEEGELGDENQTEAACRFFQRGTCLYGSQCRNPHVSNKVYNMFDPVLSNRSNLKSIEFHNPPALHPFPMLMMPDMESPWERGIKKAKIIIQKANVRREHDDLDIENDWERCLEEAKITIEKQSFKRKNLDVEKPYFDSKYSKSEKLRERSPMKREVESKIIDPNQKYTKAFHSKHEKESNYNKRTKPPDVKQTLDHLKWVDPWQRSKSPRKRTRSMSFSVSPTPPLRLHRKGSASSTSSSSSCFKHIYGNSRKSKLPRKRSRSKSYSASPLKNKRSLKAPAYSKKRSYSRSVSKSFSKSPRKRHYSCSSSSESVGKSYVRKKANIRKVTLKALPMSKFRTKNGQSSIPSEKQKDTLFPSVTKSLRSKTGRRASSPTYSDSSRCSKLTASSLTCTSVSSISDIEDLKAACFKESEEKNVSKSKVSQVSQEKKSQEAFISRSKVSQVSQEKKSQEAFVSKSKVSQVSQEKKSQEAFISKSKVIQVPPDKKSQEALKHSQKYQKDSPPVPNAIRRLSEELNKYSKTEKKTSLDRSKLQMPSDIKAKSKSPGDKTRASHTITSSKLVSQTSKTSITSSKLLSQPLKPAITSSKHVGETTKPAITSSKHVGQTSKPTISSSKHVSQTSKPTITSSTHVGQTSKLAITSSKPLGQTSKPTMTKKAINQKPSSAMMELLKYHSSGRSNCRANTSTQVSKPPEAKTVSQPVEDTNSKIAAYFKISSTNSNEVIPSKPSTSALVVSVKKEKEAVSKRRLLLRQLQAIEDAIARKKTT